MNNEIREPSIEPTTAERRYAALQGVGRAMVVLETIAAEPMRASDVVRRLGLKWTTAHRTLTYLLENDYLRRDEGSGTYSVGPRLYSLGQSYLRGHPLIDAGTPSVRAIAHEVGGTVQLNERNGFESLVLVAVDERLELIPKATPEYHFPLHAGSKGQVLLAYSPPAVFAEMTAQPLEALTDQTITDPVVLEERLLQVRSQGYAVTKGDVQRGTGSVAAPIFDAVGDLRGAICVIRRANHLDQASEPVLITATTLAARDISIRMGWRPGIPAAAERQWRTRG
jgi:DNA-binding IclR family transcriptional regulator